MSDAGIADLGQPQIERTQAAQVGEKAQIGVADGGAVEIDFRSWGAPPPVPFPRFRHRASTAGARTRARESRPVAAGDRSSRRGFGLLVWPGRAPRRRP